jgi:hypothetical protein
MKLDLRGQRFGELVAMLPVGRTRGSVRWLCQCDCGRPATRTAAQLVASRKDHFSPACHRCLAELQRGRNADARENRRSWLLELWDDRGELWTNAQLEKLEKQIREESQLTEPEDASPPFRVMEAEPVSSHKDTRAVMLRQEIGDYFGLSAERIRQIELIAFSKILKISSWDSLLPFAEALDDYDVWPSGFVPSPYLVERYFGIGKHTNQQVFKINKETGRRERYLPATLGPWRPECEFALARAKIRIMQEAVAAKEPRLGDHSGQANIPWKDKPKLPSVLTIVQLINELVNGHRAAIVQGHSWLLRDVDRFVVYDSKDRVVFDRLASRTKTILSWVEERWGRIWELDRDPKIDYGSIKLADGRILRFTWYASGCCPLCGNHARGIQVCTEISRIQIQDGLPCPIDGRHTHMTCGNQREKGDPCPCRWISSAAYPTQCAS